MELIKGTRVSNCKKCRGEGTIEYYHDAGDHFGAGRAPGSGWRVKACACQKEHFDICEEENGR